MDGSDAGVTTLHPRTQLPNEARGFGAWRRPLLRALPLLFFAVFFVWPILALALKATSGGSLLAAGQEALTSTSTWQVVWFTLWLAAVSTIVTVVVAMPGAYILGNFRFPGRTLVESLAVVAFVMPTIVVAAAIGLTLGPTSPLGFLTGGSDRGIIFILAAHTYFNLAVVLRIVGSYWAQLDKRAVLVATTLGASRWRAFFSVTWPQLRPSVWSASILVFLFSFTSFGIVLLLGELGQRTLEVEIHRQVLLAFDLPTGAVLALVQLLIVGIILIAQAWLTRRTVRDSISVPRFVGPVGRQWIGVGSFVFVSVVVLVGPVVMVVSSALQVDDGWGLTNFLALPDDTRSGILAVPPVTAIYHSLVFAIIAAFLALVIGGLIAHLLVSSSSWTESIWLLPLGVSAVTLGFGLLIAFPRGVFAESAVIIPIAQALIAIPFVVRILVPPLRATERRLLQAASCLGASPGVAWRRVQWPILRQGIGVAVGFAFAISLGEFGATIFLATGEYPTLPVAMYRLLSSPGSNNYGQAMAMATILIAMTALVVMATSRKGGSRYV